MKILWIPHTSWYGRIRTGRQRDRFIIDHLKKRHEVHVLLWSEVGGPGISEHLDPRMHMESLSASDMVLNGLYVHKLRRISAGRTGIWINQRFLHRRVGRLIDEFGLDCVVCGPNYHLVGTPPFHLRTPIFYDSLDLYGSDELERLYCSRARGVLATSRILVQRAIRYNKNTHYVPNGVDLERIRKGNAPKVRKSLGLNGKIVLSLVGMTMSSRLYFLEAMARLAEDSERLAYMFVGESLLADRMMRKARELGIANRVIMAGWSDSPEDFFQATDIGTYPVDRAPYYDAACPIKVLEYTAASKPVVATETEELKAWNFGNIILVGDEPESFARGIREALVRGRWDFPDMSGWDWSVIAREAEEILDGSI